ncbi:MAG: hypothetical protein ACYDA9_10935 [Terriglobia bacterium]
MRTSYPLAYAWLERNKKVLCERAAYRRYFDPDTAPFYSMFDVGEYTVARYKVIWLGFGARRVNAAVCRLLNGKPICGNQAMHISIPCKNLDEAYFVCGCINSSPFNAAVVMHTQIGGKSFAQGSILHSIRIPQFSNDVSTHRRVVEVVRELHEHLDNAQKLHAYEERLDNAVCGVWALSEKELMATRQVCEELSRVDFDEPNSEGLSEGQE